MNKRWNPSIGFVYVKETYPTAIYLKPKEIKKHLLTLYTEFFIFLKTCNKLKVFKSR